MRTQVELHSTDPSAIEAVRNTITMLPGGGLLEEENGNFYLVGSAFLVFACQRQGYVKAVRGQARGKFLV